MSGGSRPGIVIKGTVISSKDGILELALTPPGDTEYFKTANDYVGFLLPAPAGDPAGDADDTPPGR